jgi:penicillin amidase
MFNRTVSADGGADTINRATGTLSGDKPFADIHGSSYRAVYDLDPQGRSVFIIPTGQSGNPLSRHYDDLLPLWAKGKTIPMETDRAKMETEVPEQLRLTPAPSR